METERLKQMYIFRNLTPREIESVMGIAQAIHFPESAVIFREDDPGDALYIIVDGAVRISKVIEGVGEEALTILKPGSYFGEMALIDEHPRSAHALAHKNTTLLSIPRASFHRLLEGDRELAYKILWTMVRTFSSRLRETNRKLAGLILLSTSF